MRTDKMDRPRPNTQLKCAAHHVQLPLCNTRPQYRQGRKLKSVKTYSINDESQYLVAKGIPDINIMEEFKTVCSKYGFVEHFNPLDSSYPTEQFEKVFLIKYSNVTNARYAKRHMDMMSFYGGVLHVFYAPEKETVQDTRQKLEERRRRINQMLLIKDKAYDKKSRLRNKSKIFNGTSTSINPYIVPLTEQSASIGPQLYPSQYVDSISPNHCGPDVSRNIYSNSYIDLKKSIKILPSKRSYDKVDSPVFLPVGLTETSFCQPSIASLKMPVNLLNLKH